MGCKRNLLFIAIIIVLIGVFVFKLVQKEVKQKADNRIFEEFMKNYSLETNEYIDNISFEESELRIIYNLQFNEAFSNIPINDQFGVFYTYCKQLRKYIMDFDDKKLLFQKDIHLTGTYDDLTYQFDSVTESQGLISFNPNAVLFINGIPAYEDRQYHALIQDLDCETEIEYINGYSDKEIMDYSSRMFNLITNGGFNVEFEKDFETVMNAVCDKYDITLEDYWEIYKKYYFCVYY